MEPMLDLDDSSLEERLLFAGRDVAMSDELKVKTLTAVGAASAGIALVGATKVGGFSWLAGKGWPLALSVIGVGGAAALILTPTSQPAPRESLVIAAPSPQAPTAAQPIERPQPARAEVLAPGRERPRELDQKVADKPNKSKPKKKSSATKSLSEELKLLSQASAALSSGSPSLALKKLAEYRRSFPKPHLGLEAEILNIEALAKSGQLSTAKTRATRFVKRHPRSPLIARVNKYVQ